MNAPLICLRPDDKEFVERLLTRAEDKQIEMMQEKTESIEANVIKAIVELNRSNEEKVTCKDIAEFASKESGENYSAKSIGNIIRKNLGLKTKKTKKGFIVLYDKTKIEELQIEYGLAPQE